MKKKWYQYVWPWSRFYRYECQLHASQQMIERLKLDTEHHKSMHASVSDKLQSERDLHEISKNSLLHLTTAIWVKGGFDKISLVIVMLLASFQAFCQPVAPSWLTTNGTPLVSAPTGPFLSGPTTGAPFLTYNAGALTNVLISGLVSPTNAVASASSVDFNVPEATTNIAGAVSQTSLINFNPTNYNHAIRYYINRTGSDQTVTVGTWETDASRQTSTTYIATNNTTLALMFSMQIGMFTNVTAYKTFR